MRLSFVFFPAWSFSVTCQHAFCARVIILGNATATSEEQSTARSGQSTGNRALGEIVCIFFPSLTLHHKEDLVPLDLQDVTKKNDSSNYFSLWPFFRWWPTHASMFLGCINPNVSNLVDFYKSIIFHSYSLSLIKCNNIINWITNNKGWWFMIVPTTALNSHGALGKPIRLCQLSTTSGWVIVIIQNYD